MTLPRWLRHVTRTLLHFVGDGAAVIAAFWLAYELRFHSLWFTGFFPIIGQDPGWHLYGRLLYAVTPLWLAAFWYASRLYTRIWFSPFDRIIQIGKGAFLGTVATLAATYIYQRLAYSRLMILAAWPIGIMTVSFSHWLVTLVDRWLAQHEKVSPMLLIGGGKVAEQVRKNIHERHPLVPIHELRQFPTPKALIERTRKENISEIVLVRSDIEHDRLLELAEACETEGLNFRMLPNLLELRLGEIQIDESLGLPAYRLQHTQLNRANYYAKRIFDTSFSIGVFLVLGIPLALIALVIRLDSKGPALFKQKRIGFRGKTFDAFKFRTMVIDAEEKLAAVKKDKNSQKGGFFKAKFDPRVTRVGKWLRRYSLDEFPQFINVLRGEMSVVGPRPLALSTGEMEELTREFGTTAKKRVNTLPGITGLWQVSGRSDISSSQRFALDMFYIEHWSLGLDLEIILKTAPAMISARGAY